MWKALKYEMRYYKYFLSIFSLFVITYTILSLYDLQLTTSSYLVIDYWGALFSLIIYTYLLIVWGSRINEKRIRLHNLLPIVENHLASLRFAIAILPYVLLIIYLILFHLVIIDNWHAETGSVIGQVGITLILFAGFIRGRDDWFSHWNFGSRVRAAFVTYLIIQIIVVFIFVEKQNINKDLIDNYGVEAFHYANLIFPLLGFAILATTIFSYKKRKVYLN